MQELQLQDEMQYAGGVWGDLVNDWDVGCEVGGGGVLIGGGIGLCAGGAVGAGIGAAGCGFVGFLVGFGGESIRQFALGH